MIRPIITVPNPILTSKSRSVTFFDKKLKTLGYDMLDTMRHAPGVGLAAPQIGVPIQLAVIEYNPTGENEQLGPKIPLFFLINPKIKHYSKKCDTKIEGCLSIPGAEVNVERSKNIKVIAQDLMGKPIKLQATGFLARVIQHEVDHLNGLLITSRRV